MFKQILMISLLAAVGLMQSADAIRCYQCKSLTDANCAKETIDANSNIRQVDCDTVAHPNTMEQLKPVSKCNKVTTSDRAGIIVSRDCHFEVVGQKEGECTVSHSRSVEKCYTCTGDLCNASSAGRFMAMGLAALFAFLAVHFTL